CTLVCLAGYMRLLPKEVLDSFPNRVLNIHPALLPKFGGKGMYGMRVHEAVLRAGEAESGCTVHLVNERYDEGPIVVQLRCPVLPDDTPETLAARVLELEHRAYPEAVRKVLAGRVP
ncbi:MAG: formyltransferase family protein, partial [Fimbriimonadaceae bacterium]